MTSYDNLGVPGAIAGLSEKSHEHELLNLCLAAVQTVDEERLRAAAPATAPLRPQMLLTLLTYCYANGRYDSRDIVASVPVDRTLRYLCAGSRPLWTDLRRFRRQHRDLVAQCLAWVLGRAWRSDDSPNPIGPRELRRSNLIASEVANRLGAAALMDGADSD